MAKSLEQQLKEVEEKILKLTEKEKELKSKLKDQQKKEEEKNLFKIGELMKSMGFTTPEDVQKFLTDELVREAIKENKEE